MAIRPHKANPSVLCHHCGGVWFTTSFQCLKCTGLYLGQLTTEQAHAHAIQIILMGVNHEYLAGREGTEVVYVAMNQVLSPTNIVQHEAHGG